MGQAFVRGLNASLDNHEVSVVEHDVLNAQQCEALNVAVTATLEQATAEGQKYDVTILAVKPLDVAAATATIAKELDSTCVIVSIAAGITLDSLSENLSNFPIIRAMPNIAASQLMSATAMCCADRVSEKDEASARTVLEAVGTIVRVNEEEMNLVTAISGSGPAYFFLLTEYIASAAQELGMDAEVTHQLVIQTFLGAAAVIEGNSSFSALREQVTSPGGTTQAAIESFQSEDLEKVIFNGIRAALERASDLNATASSAYE